MVKDEKITSKEESKKGTQNIAKWKIEKVSEISKELDNYSTIAILDMENLPSKQLQTIRAKLKDKAKILMTKRRILKRAFESSNNKKLTELISLTEGMPAILFSNLNAFELFKILKQNQSTAPAKAGQTAPNDIWVEEGVTPFAPGPVIGELGTAGIKAGIDSGKVVIKQRSLVVKKGDKVPAGSAGILARLGVEPMKIGINLLAALENGEIYKKEVLDFDEEELINKIRQAQSESLALALERSIINSETISVLITKAEREAKHLATEQNILCSETVGNILSKAEGQAQALNQKTQSQ